MLRAASRFQQSFRRASLVAPPVNPISCGGPGPLSAVASMTTTRTMQRSNEQSQIPQRRLASLPRVHLAVSATINYPHQLQRQQHRFFSASSSSSGDFSSGDFSSSTDPTSNSSAVNETLDKLFEFQDEQQQLADAASVSSDSWFSTGAETAADVAWEATWYNLSDQAIVAVQNFHAITGLEYGWSIVGVTVLLRLALFPLMVKSQQTTSRMAHLQPELTVLKQRYEALGTPSRQDQVTFGQQMKSLFEKYEVKPMRAFIAPLVQLPLFMGMFFGLRKMPSIFPDELSVGGMFWFVDLTIPDPLYILPLASASSFLLLIEMGKDQMMAQNPAQGQLFTNVFRIMAIAMIPVCISFESAMLCYWTANNVLTIAQTALLKSNSVKGYFGIWDAPKPVPGMKPESLTEAATKLVKQIQGEAVNEKQMIERHNQAVDAKKKAKAFQRTTTRQNHHDDYKRGITGRKG